MPTMIFSGQEVASLFVWSPWEPLEGCWRGKRLPERAGIYRLRHAQEILVMGQGRIADRFKTYHADEALEGSWVSCSWLYHRQLELVCDLIALLLLQTGVLPSAQWASARLSRSASPDAARWTTTTTLPLPLSSPSSTEPHSAQASLDKGMSAYTGKHRGDPGEKSTRIVI
jgi:hypothetical protein